MISVSQWFREPIVYVAAWWVFAVALLVWMIWYEFHDGHRKHS